MGLDIKQVEDILGAISDEDPYLDSDSEFNDDDFMAISLDEEERSEPKIKLK